MEIIEEIVRLEGSRACAFPEKIRVRKHGESAVANVITSEVIGSFSVGSQQVSGSIRSGFTCRNDEQLNNEQCDDYEIQMCCPRKFTLINSPFRPEREKGEFQFLA